MRHFGRLSKAPEAVRANGLCMCVCGCVGMLLLSLLCLDQGGPTTAKNRWDRSFDPVGSVQFRDKVNQPTKKTNIGTCIHADCLRSGNRIEMHVNVKHD